jgi:hypothetical protein
LLFRLWISMLWLVLRRRKESLQETNESWCLVTIRYCSSDSRYDTVTSSYETKRMDPTACFWINQSSCVLRRRYSDIITCIFVMAKIIQLGKGGGNVKNRRWWRGCDVGISRYYVWRRVLHSGMPIHRRHFLFNQACFSSQSWIWFCSNRFILESREVIFLLTIELTDMYTYLMDLVECYQNALCIIQTRPTPASRVTLFEIHQNIIIVIFIVEHHFIHSWRKSQRFYFGTLVAILFPFVQTEF